MSALAMMLSAALLAGNAPGLVPGETHDGLELGGLWVGECISAFDRGTPISVKGDKALAFYADGSEEEYAWRLAAHGEGEVQLRLGGTTCLGVYRRAGGNLTIRFTTPDRHQSKLLPFAGERYLLTLRRVSPRK